MPVQVVVGAQWGDEGKGKIVHALAEQSDIIVRYNGGANAGHTLIVEGAKVVLHLLPVGIVQRFKTNLVGPYMVCDPEVIVKELAVADVHKSEVLLDPRAAVVLPVHKLLDGGREGASGASAIGTTKKGIGPCYEDYVSRRGLRLGNLIGKDEIRAELERGRYYEEKLALAGFHGIEGVPSLDETIEWAAAFIKPVEPRLCDTVDLVRKAAAAGKHILFEGAQGVNLDIVGGTRPYQTSSFCGAGGVSASFGLTRFERVIGVAKAYATRVGGGPFPSEMCEADDEKLRQAGSEFGASTGRSRRCGWLDLPLLRASCDAGGITELVINKVDVLGTTFDEFQVAVRDGKYVKLPGWGADVHLSNIRMREKLPVGATTLFDLIEKHAERPVIGIGTGPRREDIIWKRD